MEVVSYEDRDIDKDSGEAPAFSRVLEEITRQFVKFEFCSHNHFVYLQRRLGGGSSGSGSSSSGSGSGQGQGSERKRSLCESSGKFRALLQNLSDELIYLYNDTEQALQHEHEHEQYQGSAILDCLEEVLQVTDGTQTLWHLLEFMVLNPSHATWLQAIAWLREGLCSISTIDLKAAIALFESTDNPEFISDDGSVIGVSGGGGGDSGGDGDGVFWQTVFSLLTQGCMTDAWTILKLHSEVAAALCNPSSVHHSSANYLAEIFALHPTVLMSLEGTDPELFSDPIFLRRHVTAWQTWISRVRVLLDSNYALIVGIPPLDHMLRFFVGGVKTLLSEHEPSTWQEVAMLRLMFSPMDNSHARLSSQDVSRVLLNSISQIRGNDNTSGYTKVVKSLLDKELGDFLTFCASPPSWDVERTSSPQELLRDVFLGITLVNTMHVATLLSLSGDLSGDSAQGAFVEKSVVAGCQQLRRMNFPHEIFSLYLETLCSPDTCQSTLKALLCPEVASPADITLGTLQPATSDAEALELCEALLAHEDELLTEAQSVLVTRGLFWLKQSNEAKALYFFSQAQAHSRATALLDASLQRCIVSFCSQITLCSGMENGASFDNVDALAIDYKQVQDIHSTTSRLYTSCAEEQDSSEVNALESLQRELSNAEELLSVIENHPHFPLLSSEVLTTEQKEGGCWEDEEASGRILTTYTRLVHSLLQYLGVFQDLVVAKNSADAVLGRELFLEGAGSLQSAADGIKQFIETRFSLESPSAWVSSTEFSIPQRYWLHVVDLAVWISKQNSQLHTSMSDFVEVGERVNSNGLFNKDEVGKLRRLLLQSQLSYVPTRLNGSGMRPDGGLLTRECRRPGESNDGPCQRSKERDQFDDYEMDLHTELLDMEVSALCMDNQQQFSAASPLGFYSTGAAVVTSMTPSQYSRPSSNSVRTNAAVHRYLSAPVALQSWRREVLS